MICEKYQANTDPEFRTRAILIKEQRAELVKHHLWVLWTDYFKPPHFEKYPHLHQLFNEATKLAGAAGAKGCARPGQGRRAAREDRGDLQDLLGDQAGVSLAARTDDPAGTSRGRAGRRRHGARAGRLRTRRRPVPPHRRAADAGAVRRRSPALFGHVAVDARRRAGRLRAVVPQLLHLGRRARHLPGGPLRPPGRPGHRRRPARCSPRWPTICVRRGYRRLEWWMLDWNPAAGFYAAIGAEPMTRVGPVPAQPGDALRDLGRAGGGRRPRARTTDRVESRDRGDEA